MWCRGSEALKIGLLVLLGAGCQSGSTRDVETHTVSRGEFVNSMTVTGELEAVSSKVVSAPAISWRFGQLKITRIVDDGTQVEEGEVLVEFDKAEVEKSISDAQAELEIAEAELRKAKANHKSTIESMEIDLETTGLDHEIAQLRLEQAAFKADIDRKQVELQLETAGINLEKARQELANKKRVHVEEISKLELKRQQVQTKLAEAKETVAKLTVKAPAPGIAIIRKSWMTRAKFQVDDQCYPGWPMIGLPDLSQMKAKVEVNEVDIAKAVVGQESKIRMDAYPDTSFGAKVTEIATLARNKSKDSKVKVFDVTAELKEQDEKLMPGMTVSCEIMVEQIPDTLSIPLDAAFTREGETVVFLQSGSGFKTRKVVLGPENENHVIVISGLKAGDRVSLVDPTALARGGEQAAEESQQGDAK
jgi:HlyD family secretion protein